MVCVFTLVSLAQALLVSFKGHKCKRHENDVSKKPSWCRNGLEIVPPHLCHVCCDEEVDGAPRIAAIQCLQRVETRSSWLRCKSVRPSVVEQNSQ